MKPPKVGEGLPPTQGDVDLPPDDDLLDVLKLLLGNGWSDGEEIQAAKGTVHGYFEDVHLKIILLYMVKKHKDNQQTGILKYAHKNNFWDDQLCNLRQRVTHNIKYIINAEKNFQKQFII